MFAQEPQKSVKGDEEEFLVPAAITDTGCERELNEDRYAVIESPSGVTWCVCDGMGGASGGELAAQLAIDAIRRDLENLPARSARVAIKSAILEANRIIVLRRQNPAFSGMGTTVVAATFAGQEVVLASAGDSRAYLIRDGALQQLTNDHTYVQQLVEKGQIAPEDALSHPQAHVLTRAIGSQPGLEVDVKRFWLWEAPKGTTRDCLVLCSDGLYSLVSESEIANSATQYPPQRACSEMVELAKSRGGFDNITIAIIPLAGQLKGEPPLGYEEKAVRDVRGTSASNPVESGGGMRLLLVVLLLSGLAVVLTALSMAFMISRS